MQLLIHLALIFVALPCHGHRVQKLLDRRDGHHISGLESGARPATNKRAVHLATLLFAVNGARQSHNFLLGRSFDRQMRPRGRPVLQSAGNWEEYQAYRRQKDADSAATSNAPTSTATTQVSGPLTSAYQVPNAGDAEETTPNARTGRAAVHAARQAEARKAIEEAARMTEMTAKRASELAARMEQASKDMTIKKVVHQEGIAEEEIRRRAAEEAARVLESRAAAERWKSAQQVEEATRASESQEAAERWKSAQQIVAQQAQKSFAQQPNQAVENDEKTEVQAKIEQRVEEKSLPELLSEGLSIPSMPSLPTIDTPTIPNIDTPSVDARTARLLFPFLGIAGLAAGSALYDDAKPKASSQPTAPAPKATPIAAPKAATTEVAPKVATAEVASSMDAAAAAALTKFFPGALDSETMDKKIATVLDKRGYTKANTLLASSMCPDEVNSDTGDLVDLMKTRWGENFGLGGLAGLPFVGKAGFSAYAHHVPDNGKLLVMFAPHVGIDFDGKVGKLRRLNQKGVSTACGAAIGAYNGIMKEALAGNNGDVGPTKTLQSRNDFDGQIEYIKAKLRPRLQGIDNAPDEIAFVTYQMYAIVREFLIDQVLTAPGVWQDVSELSVVGGIMVNFGSGGDRFMPLFFQARPCDKCEVVDLYKEAFGNRPDLSYVLGDRAKAANFYNYDLSTLSMSAEDKLFKLFPGALDSATMDSKVANTLTKYGYTSANTLFATSTCPDEVNSKQGELVELMKARWGENFALGGLAGLPFVGKSGFSAYAHHVPDNGKLLVMFAPHVGIDFDGKVGALKRLNQKGVSTACGAAIGAYNGIIKEALDRKSASSSGSTAMAKQGDAFDAQIEYIKTKLRERLQGIDKAPDPIGFITYQMYAIVREFVDDVLAASDLFEDASEVCILGGIMVNGDTGDHFMPLLFESKNGRTADTNDLYVETFGYRPDLSYVLGDEAMARSFYKTDLRALK